MRRTCMLGAVLLLSGSFCAPSLAQNAITPDPDRGPTTAAPGTDATRRATSMPTEPQLANEYVKSASIGDMFEVESSNLALMRSKDTKVQQFAKHMVNDHTKSTMMLKDILAKEKISPQPADKLDAEKTALLKKLQNAADNEFSRMYLKIQLDAHQQALTVHQDYAAHGTNNALSQFAKDTAGVVKSHLDMVKNLEQNMAAR